MNLKYQYYYVKNLIKRYGVAGLIQKTIERSKSPMAVYTKSYLRYLPTEEDLNAQRKNPLSYAPLVSIVIPVYETPKQYLCGLIDSVLAQSYPNWEICFADGSRTDNVKHLILEYAQKDARIHYQKLFGNGGISENTNSGFAMANGEYIALMDHDDLLTENALYEMVKCLNEAFSKEERALAMIYSDEDKISGEQKVHSRPHFKPDFNLEFLRHNNYFCHFLMFSAKLLKKAGGLKKEYDGAQDYDFVLRCVDAGAVVRHVPKILYHWRIHEGSTAGNSADKSYAFDNGCRAIEAHLARCKEPGKAEVTTNLGVYKITYALRGLYRITVAAEEEKELLRIKNHYQNMSFADKEYTFQIQYQKVDSFCNEMVERFDGDYILYLKKGVRSEQKHLIETLLGTCQQSRNGIVGAKLLTGKKKVFSCGLIYDAQGRLIPSCGGLPKGYKGYFLHAVIPQNVSVLSFDCVMFRRNVFVELGGIDETIDPLHREADFCFRLTRAGYGVIVTPMATAVRRAAIQQKEDVQKKRIFFERWKEKLAQPDPCYNCNLSLKDGHTYAVKDSQA